MGKSLPEQGILQYSKNKDLHWNKLKYTKRGAGMGKKIINGIMYFFSIILIIAGLSGLLQSALISDVLISMLGFLLFPPLLNQLEKSGKKPTKTKRAIIGAALLIAAIIFLPSTANTDIQQSNSINSDTAGYVDVNENNSSSESIESATVNKESTDLVKEDADSSQLKESELRTNISNGEMTVHFIDVGQGDSILINADGQFMLIDAGEDGDAVVNYLKGQGVDNLKYVIGTHPHGDHIGGLDNVINLFKIDKIIMPDVTGITQAFEEVLDAISEKGLKVTKPVVGKEYSLGEATFTILAPNSSEYSDLNNYSVVIKLEYGKTSFLLTGDAEEISEAEMLHNGLDLSADVIKLGHHGSSNSSSEEFLDAVNASSAVVSVGENNQYGHPATDTLIKVLDRKMNLYRTDEMGTIVATSDGKKVTFNKKADIKSLKVSIDKATATPLPTLKPESAATPTPAPEQKIEEPVSKEITVYVTNTGSKYHREGCQYLRQSQIPISLDDAISEGYEPCSRCNPPR